MQNGLWNKKLVHICHKAYTENVHHFKAPSHYCFLFSEYHGFYIVLTYLRKWKTAASTTLYGRAYFLSKKMRKNMELAPV